jgi:hypothetical protein
MRGGFEQGKVEIEKDNREPRHTKQDVRFIGRGMAAMFSHL